METALQNHREKQIMPMPSNPSQELVLLGQQARGHERKALDYDKRIKDLQDKRQDDRAESQEKLGRLVKVQKDHAKSVEQCVTEAYALIQKCKKAGVPTVAFNPWCKKYKLRASDHWKAKALANLGQPELLQTQYKKTRERKRAVHKTGAMVRDIRSTVRSRNQGDLRKPKTIEDKRKFIIKTVKKADNYLVNKIFDILWSN